MAARAVSRSPLGTALPDRYELLRHIAHGGMATVWCGRDLLLDRTVAIKLLAEQLAADETAVRRFKREARAAARLSGHRNVVTIYDVGQTPADVDSPSARPFIVMEHLRGGTVADALRAARVRPHRALRWLREAAAAIDFAHGQGVIHRDIKPSNFLLDDSRALHVADFGIALVATEETVTSSGQLLGTAAYLAPEMALGQPATAASDRYALAVAAFELLTGEKPFREAHFAAQARQHIEAPLPLASMRNPSLPKAVDEVLARGLAKRPEQRFETAAGLVGALDTALQLKAPRAITAAPIQPKPPRAITAAPIRLAPRREYRRHGYLGRRTAIAALLAAAVATAGIAAAVAGGGRPLKRAAAVHQNHATAPAAHAAPALGASNGQASDAFEARGHQLMLSGDYSGAIPVLRQAVAVAPRGSLTYAYALYDLGRSLRLSGDPSAAIPILEQRLAIPDQTAVVRNELVLAVQEAAQTNKPTSSAGESPPSGPAAGSGHDQKAAHKHDAGGPGGHGGGGD